MVLLFVFGFGVFYWYLTNIGFDLSNYQIIKPEEQKPAVEYPNKVKLTSSVFKVDEKIPEKYTCVGEDINPPLSITGTPAEAKSLVLILDDPDAPFKTWTHWVIYNINPATTEIEEDSVPKGAYLGENDFGKGTYVGPCPPAGRHRYNFYLYALDRVLELDEGANREELEEAMEGHIIDVAVPLIGYFEK
ncbi:YbhB/YbcL family Raf kinase inhibitor-like protein [candidate division WWE3 bacterium]|uniref:YbhB/YbcL family Raf kinase inhibitor-like protein n=1 Tax=candidate division WWE3 bacterium TaxID=2053526 RepID=A0A3A4ZP37_UNCKA|nr:MAG: YbhB/YbcL family Raf kinase inhibitor-like protein [candidate division WWE3 bacterium]